MQVDFRLFHDYRRTFRHKIRERHHRENLGDAKTDIDEIRFGLSLKNDYLMMNQEPCCSKLRPSATFIVLSQ